MADDFAANGALIKEVSEGYDALGNRITEGVRDAASLTPALQRFAIEGQDVLADLNGGNQMILRYLRGDAVDQVLASEGPRDSLSVQVITPIGGPVSWLLTDRQGSVRDVTDGSGTIVDHIDYGSFGERVAETNPNGGSRYGYTGREWDAALDLQYNRARFYDPATGNFIEEDPSGFSAGDPNLSRYVGNGPTNGTDPSGLHDPNHQPFPTGSSGGLHVLGTIPNPRPLNHEEIAFLELIGYPDDLITAAVNSQVPASVVFDTILPAQDPLMDPTAGLNRGNSAGRETKEGIGSFLEGAIAGDFSDNESWSTFAGQVVGGFNPGADVRDVAAGVRNIFDGKPGAWIGFGAALLGGVPVFGDGAKAAIRAGRKLGSEVLQETAGELAETGAKEIGAKALIDLGTFDFGKHLRGLIGDPPSGMIDPHAHHILFKKGIGPSQQGLVEEGQAILRKVGIDPILGKENLVWAPWRISKQHGIESLENVVARLREFDKSGADYDDFVEAVQELGRIAAQRTN